MFTLHIHLTTTQRTYQLCGRLNTWTSKGISNNHIVSFVIWKNIVNSFIPRWGGINNEKNNALGKYDANLPIVGVLMYYFEDKRLSHLLTTMSCRPTACIDRLHNAMNTHSKHMWNACVNNWEPNKLRTQLWSKENHVSFRVVTSFWVKSIPFWMGHLVETKGRTTTYFHIVPPTQWLKSSKLKYCIGVLMICYEIVPKTLSNMEQEFHL